MNAIIDGSVIITLHSLGIFEKLNLLFENVLIPTHVEHDFFEVNDELQKDERLKLLLEYDEKYHWFNKCQSFRDDRVKIYNEELKEKNSKKSHLGESEVLAQNEELGGNNVLLLDDQDARKIAERMNFAKHGTLFILCVLDIYENQIDYRKSVAQIKKNIKFRSETNIENEVYEKIAKLKLSGKHFFSS